MDTALSMLGYSNSSCDILITPFVNMTHVKDSLPIFCHFLWFHETIAGLIAFFCLLFIFATCFCCCNCTYFLLFFCLVITSPVWEVGVPVTLIIYCCCCRAGPGLQRSCCCCPPLGPRFESQYTPQTDSIMPRIQYTPISQV